MPAPALSGLVAKLFARPASRRDRRRTARLGLESLESREVPAVTFTVEDLSDATEGGGTGQFRVTANGDSSDFTSTVVGLVLSLTGTATYSTDYSSSPAVYSYLYFNSPGATATVTITAVDDSSVEGDETVTLTVQRYLMYPTGPSASDTLTLHDNDTSPPPPPPPPPPLPNVTVTKIDDGAENGGSGLFRFARTGSTDAELEVAFSAGGTATADEDYVDVGSSVLFLEGSASVDVYVAPLNDSTPESGGETVTATITAGSSYTVGNGSQSTQTATMTIGDDDETPVVSVVALCDAVEGGMDGSFSLSRSGDPTDPLTVTYTVVLTGPGYATPGYDYAGLSGSVTFAAGVSTAAVSVEALADALTEGVEYVSVVLDEGTDYDVGSSDQADVIIGDASDSSSIYGRWFLDVNGNAVDDGEDGYDYSRVYLFRDGARIDRAFTDYGGGYGFTGLAPGTYDVLFDTPVGLTPTTSVGGWHTAIEVEPAAEVEVSEGCQPPAAPAATGVRDGIDWGTFNRASIRAAAPTSGITGTEYDVRTAAGNMITVFRSDPAAAQSADARGSNLDIRYNCHGLSFNTRLVTLADGGLYEFAITLDASVQRLLTDQYDVRTAVQGRADIAAGKRVIAVFVNNAMPAAPVHSAVVKRLELTEANTLHGINTRVDTKNGWLQLAENWTFSLTRNFYADPARPVANRVADYALYSLK